MALPVKVGFLEESAGLVGGKSGNFHAGPGSGKLKVEFARGAGIWDVM